MQVNTEQTELALKHLSVEVSNFVSYATKQVEALEEKYGSIVPVATTEAGYRECKKVRSELLPIKKRLEDARKSLKTPILEAGRLVDSTMKPLTERVGNIIKPFEDAYRAVDQEIERKKQERINKINDAFKQFDDVLLSCVGSSSTFIETVIEEMADFDLDPKVFQERTDEAAEKHNEVMGKLSVMLQQAIEQEEFEAKKLELEKREKALSEAESKLQPQNEPRQEFVSPEPSKVDGSVSNESIIQAFIDKGLAEPDQARLIVEAIESGEIPYVMIDYHNWS